jgi:hypothetical protein
MGWVGGDEYYGANYGSLNNGSLDYGSLDNELPTDRRRQERKTGDGRDREIGGAAERSPPNFRIPSVCRLWLLPSAVCS